jgi:hypothetical protein
LHCSHTEVSIKQVNFQCIVILLQEERRDLHDPGLLSEDAKDTLAITNLDFAASVLPYAPKIPSFFKDQETSSGNKYE